MRTSQHRRTGEPPETDSRLPAHGHARSGSPGTTVAVAIVVAILVAGATGATVYVWQHELVSDRTSLLAAALRERDEARGDVEALRADADRSAAEILAFQAEVARLESRVERLRSAAGEIGGGPVAPVVCNASDFLAAIRAQVSIAAPMVWDSVTIQACRGDYAFVLAHPGNIPQGSNVEDSEQVILRNDAGEWVVIASGTGISCSDPDIIPGLEQACSELGLP
ncbi:MAG TPA: hypothetical protein VF028_05365 [Actinomycetota bacterium]|jgi:hypothetical protein|nr:hypothetical protein [Actinomycetota bacterium]